MVTLITWQSGGDFKRIVSVEFVESGEEVEIRQMFTTEEDGKFFLTTEIAGTVPQVEATDNTDVDMTPVEYIKSGTGELEMVMHF